MPENANLGSVITDPIVRKVIYTVYVIAGILIGALQVAYSALGGGQPDWLTVALSVLAYLSIPIGGLALANTPPQTALPPAGGDGPSPVDTDFGI